MKSKRAQEAAAAAEDKPVEAHDDAAPRTKKRKRSGDDEVEGGGKKAKKDKKKKKKGEKESRKDKKDKRKDLQDLPGEDDNDAEAANGDVNGQPPAAEEETKKKKKDKTKYNKNKDKKSKKDKEDEETPKKKSKKDKKKTSSSDETTAAAAPEDAIPNGASNGIDLDVEDAAAAAAEGKDDKAARHIVFVGNLPYTATAASISAHFASLSPIAVRCLTQKGGDASHTCRGIAFVEFANAITQRTCLDRFHHSEFDDGHSPARKINVELT
ncbi:hypothetical protein MY11210_009499 [Beauveria gryllotalpidicola]